MDGIKLGNLGFHFPPQPNTASSGRNVCGAVEFQLWFSLFHYQRDLLIKCDESLDPWHEHDSKGAVLQWWCVWWQADSNRWGEEWRQLDGSLSCNIESRWVFLKCRIVLNSVFTKYLSKFRQQFAWVWFLWTFILGADAARREFWNFVIKLRVNIQTTKVSNSIKWKPNKTLFN